MNGFAMKTNSRAKKRIADQLAAHKEAQTAESTNWGFAGDLGRITEQLAYVLAALGDRSAVDEKGLQC